MTVANAVTEGELLQDLGHVGLAVAALITSSRQVSRVRQALDEQVEDLALARR